MASPITLQELLDFHSIDRQLYARLVLGLGLDSNLSQQVVAFWFWLERKRYKDFIKVMLNLPDQLVYGLAIEAKTCFDCLNIEQSLAHCFDHTLVFPFMISFVSKDFSIVQLYQDREKALKVMGRFLKNVCGKIFSDIIIPTNNLLPNSFQVVPVMVNGFPVQSSEAVSHVVQVPVLLPNGVDVPPMMANPVQAQGQAFVPNGVPVLHVGDNGVRFKDPVSNGVQGSSFVPNEIQGRTLVSNGAQVSPLVPNGTRVQTAVSDGVQVTPLVPNGIQVVVANGRNLQTVTRKDENGTQVMPNGAQNLLNVSEHNRTLFITFSKGHQSISKPELRDLITRNFGYCVESIHMRVDPPPLFALVVLKSASALKKVLGDKDLVKLSINGKDVWLRRFLLKQEHNHL